MRGKGVGPRVRGWGAVARALLGLLGAGAVAHAAINPADPGLPAAEAYGERGIPNNGASAMCVECHTENPTPGKGTHFVLNALTGSLRTTHSGGGWPEAAWGVRDSGEFFKISPWLEDEWGNGGSSKYGDSDTWESVVYTGGDPVIAAEACRPEANPAAMGSLELICESCHNLRANVEGRYNLLAKVTSSPVPDDTVEGGHAPLCVGCHGFLYQDDGGEANSLHSNWNDPRNFSLAAGRRRGNNEKHYIGGKPYPRNHHVMTGDAIDIPLAEAGLLLRDVAVLSPDLVSKPIRTDWRKGTMPIRPVALAPITLPSDPSNLHCVTCHAPAHGGEPSMGAAILRGVDLQGKDSGFGIDRIFDGKEWGRYADYRFCGNCHE
ncbi:MAG: hypothetical protein GXP50_14300 [Deltaproteobacteria bacterium]|nr:hypothetical protein [Deltaproteobacteria bacterium]